ncbi:MAG: pilus assembly protein N-terminal domain-containing protein [Ancalomicrobiaceae bacterium]|nr:pilus assembly protein N-terminal domain-containing protein [Ancalomicrobiaceae bacterium]
MRLALIAAATLAVLAVDMPPALGKEPIVVMIDRAKVMRLPAPAGTVIIGNPGIADASVQDRLTLVLTGKSVGLTNLVVLDAKGNPIADEVLSVSKSEEGLVTVQKATSRFSYYCTPHCNPTVEVGDAPEFNGQAIAQIQGRNNFAQQTGATQP